MPRRKGARAAAVGPAESGGESAPGDAGDDRAGRAGTPTLDDLFGFAAPVAADSPDEDESPAPTDEPEGEGEELDLTAPEKSDEIRDLALAAEGTGTDEDGREVTAPPSDADQSETVRIVTEAVEAGASTREIQAAEAGTGRNVPPLPPTEPFSTDEVEGRDSEMHQP